MFNTIAAFFMSMLLWHLTWGWKHIIINIFIMPFLFFIIGRLSIIKSILLTLLSHICVSTFYISVTILVFVYLINYQFTSDDYLCYLHIYETPIRCAMAFAGLYAVLQSLFLILLQRWIVLSLRSIITVVILSNLLSAYILSGIIYI